MIVEGLRNGDFTAEEIVEHYLEKIERVNNTINAYVRVYRDLALSTARRIDEKIKKGEEIGVLAGVPIAVKDNILIRGLKATASSRILEDFVSPYDATVISRIKREDGILIGHTNMDEFGMGSTTEFSIYGATRNPWNTRHVAGGSSGGSAAAIAADIAVLALGSDTGGSIRCPASYTYTYGLKPSYGTVSRRGLIAYANSLEQIGPLARSASDLRLLYSVISGKDPLDSTTISSKPRIYTASDIRVEKLRIAIAREFVEEGIDNSVRKLFYEFLDKISSEVAGIEEVSIPELKYALPAYYVIAMAEAQSNLARYSGIIVGKRVTGNSWENTIASSRSAGFGKEVKRRMLLGAYVLMAGYKDKYYIKALQVRRLIKNKIEHVLAKHDILVCPTTPIPPPRIGEKLTDPLSLYMMDILTVPANLSGLPALNMPLGFVSAKLPVGVQLIGKYLDDFYLIAVAEVLSKITGIESRVAEI